MKKITAISIASLALLLIVFAPCEGRDRADDETEAAAGKKASPAKIIFDTDIMGDADDLGCVAMLHALADLGEVEILAMGISSKNPWSPLCLSTLNFYFGRGHVPIGVLRGAGFRNRSRYAQKVAEEFPRSLKSIAGAPDAAKLYRQALCDAPDGSVVVISVGFLSNLRDLLKTPPDSVSPLNGRELVRKKVKTWVCMGGRFPSGRDGCNLRCDSQAAGYVLRHWPTKAVFSGGELGAKIQTGKGLTTLPKDSPIRRGYELFNGIRNRSSWDQCALLYAVRGLDGRLNDVWGLRHGTMKYDVKSFKCTWKADSEGRHAYMTEKMAPKDVARMIEALMLHVPLAGVAQKSATEQKNSPDTE